MQRHQPRFVDPAVQQAFTRECEAARESVWALIRQYRAEEPENVWAEVCSRAWAKFPKMYAEQQAALAAGKRVVELVVVSRGNAVHADGTPSVRTAMQWHSSLFDYLARINQAMTLVDPSGVSWAVAIEEFEDRLSPLGGQWLLEWETRIVFVEL